MNKSISKATVEWIQNKNRITELVSNQPVKWLNPVESPDYCALYLSGYGGGIVQGDQIEIQLNAKANTKVALTTQSFTKAFKNDLGVDSLQEMISSLEEKATLVFLPDPLIPQKKSRLKNKQQWDLEKGSSLIIADWFNAGRSTMDEVFSFQKLETELSIKYDNEILIWENFNFTPASIPSQFPSIFGQEKAILNAFLIDMENPQLIEEDLKDIINQLNLNPVGEGYIKEKTLHGNAELLEPGIINLKFSGSKINDLEPVIKCLNDIASKPHWLAAKPFNRKF